MTPEAREAAQFREKCFADPFLFSRVAWPQRKYWAKQVEFKRLLHAHDRVWAKGGHSTGKTNEAAFDTIEDIALHPGAQGLVIGATFETAKMTLWSEIRQAYFGSKLKLGGVMGTESWKLGDGWFLKLASADKPESLHGVHGRHVRIHVDEASALNPDFWPSIDSLMASEGARLIVTFNPIHAEHHTREIVSDPAFKGVTFNCEDHPNVVEGKNLFPGAVTRSWVNAFKERVERGLSSRDEYRSRVQGEFPLGGDDDMVTRADLESVKDGVDVKDHRRAGLDVAYKGGDKNVLTIIDENRCVEEVVEWIGMDPMETCGKFIDECTTRKIQPEYASIDVGSFGAAVLCRCHEVGFNAAPCDFSGGVKNDWPDLIGSTATPLNRRAELHMIGRALIRGRQACIPDKFVRTWADMVVPKLKYSSNAKLKVESKDEIRTRIHRSPDYSDSFLIAFNVSSAEGWFDP